MGAARSAVAVLIVSDYGGRTDGDWDYLRATLGALGRQASEERGEVLLVDSTPPGQHMPPDLLTLVPSLRVIGGAGKTTTELLNTAVQATSAELIALFDGDCAPVPGWLRAGIDAVRAHPDAAAVSGRTVYQDTGFRNRVLATLSRSLLDPGGPAFATAVGVHLLEVGGMVDAFAEGRTTSSKGREPGPAESLR